MIESLTELRVRYCEVDKMGIVHHSHYFSWFEVGRIQLLDEIGLSYKALEANGYFLPVLYAQSEYYAPARFDDRVTLHTAIPKKPGVRIDMHCKMFCADKLLCQAQTQHAFINAQGQAIRPPKDLLAKFQSFFD